MAGQGYGKSLWKSFLTTFGMNKLVKEQLAMKDELLEVSDEESMERDEAACNNDDRTIPMTMTVKTDGRRPIPYVLQHGISIKDMIIKE